MMLNEQEARAIVQSLLRAGEAAEFTRTACFLASDAGSCITGTALNVDGGMAPVV